MNEQLIVSGRDIPELYPHVDVWGFGIPLYLFIGGLAAGILIFATYYYLRGKADEMPATVKISTLIPPVIIAIGLFFLIEDLHHPAYFWQLMTHFRIESPMSWGAWVLTTVFIMSIFWPLSFLDDIIKFFEEKNRTKWANSFEKIKKTAEKLPLIPKLIELTKKYRNPFASVLFVLSIILGIYTGILLSALNARPLWNNSILGPLFLTSGISTGAAAIMWISDNKAEKNLFGKMDTILIIIELFFIIHMVMGMFAGTEYQIVTARMLVGGEYTLVFWVLFVGLGLLFPLTLELMEMKGLHIPAWIPAFFVLAGGLLFRVLMVTIGQISSIPH